jgi:hypothetical protein
VLKVINAGLGRTGTTSLHIALDRLGFGPSFHMFDVVGNQTQLQQWEAVVCDAQVADWNEIFKGYSSAVDGPCAIYYREIQRAFPDAKMILTVRDPEDWYRSTFDTLYQFALRSRAHPPAAGTAPYRLFRITNSMIWNGLFEGRFHDKDHAIRVYQRHNDEVVRTLGPGNVFVHDVQHGWAPLCEFLEVEVPPESYPRANDTETMRGRVAQASAVAPHA